MTNVTATLNTLLSYSRTTLIERAERHSIDASAYTSKRELATAIFNIETQIDVTPTIIETPIETATAPSAAQRTLSSKKSMRNAIRHILDTAIDAPATAITRIIASSSGVSVNVSVTHSKGETEFATDDFLTNDQRAFYAHLSTALNIE